MAKLNKAQQELDRVDRWREETEQVEKVKKYKYVCKDCACKCQHTIKRAEPTPIRCLYSKSYAKWKLKGEV